MARQAVDHALMITDFTPVQTNVFTLWALLRSPLQKVLAALQGESVLDVVLPVPQATQLNALGKTLEAIYAMLESLCGDKKLQTTIIPIHARSEEDTELHVPSDSLHLPTIETLLASGTPWTQLYVVDAEEARYWREQLYGELRKLAFGGFCPIYQHASVPVEPGLLLPDAISAALHRQPSSLEDVDLRIQHGDLKLFNHVVKAMLTTALVNAVTRMHSAIQLAFEHVRCEQIIGHLKDVRAFVLRLRFSQQDIGTMWLMAHSQNAGMLASKIIGSDYGVLTVIQVPHDEAAMDMLA